MRMAGDEWRSRRFETYGVSWASEPAWGKTQRSLGTPRARARSTEHSTSAAPCSTALFEFMSLGYGKPTMRLEASTVRISSGVNDRWIQAFGLLAATSLKRLHS